MLQRLDFLFVGCSECVHEILICSLGVYLAKRSIMVPWFLNPDNHIFINLLICLHGTLKFYELSVLTSV